jgi:Protein of unknown function (DUF3592)
MMSIWTLTTNDMNFNIRYLINILCVPVLLAGGHFCLQGVETIKIANETYSWKKAEGNINYSGIEKSTSTDKHKRVYRKPIIKYTYIANNRNYQGDTIYWGDDKSSSQVSYTDDVISRYPKNKRITVHYDPMNPQRSVLEVGTSEVTFTLIIIGGILIFVGTSLPILFFLFRHSPTGSMELNSWKK